MATSRKRPKRAKAVKPEPKAKAKPKARTRKAKPKLARHAKRVKMTATSLIRSLPVAMPAKEVVRRAKARGLKLRPELVYNVRSKMRESSAFSARNVKENPPVPSPKPVPASDLPVLPERTRKIELDLVSRTILIDAHKRILKECADEFLASYLAKLAAVVKAVPSMPHSIGEILVLIMAAIAQEG